MSHEHKTSDAGSPQRPRVLVALWRFVRRLWCAHKWQWSHNYYGDQIIYNGWNRSAWKCTRCGAWQDRPELHKDPRCE